MPALPAARTPVAKRPTIRQVAQLAGVSHQTVSRFLRSDATLLPTTLAKVRSAVDELDYRPNLVARSMRTQRTGMLAIVLPGWTGVERSLRAASEVAQEAGYRVEVVIGVGEGPSALAQRAAELLTSGQVEGVLSFSPIEVDPELEGYVLTAAQYDDRLRAVDAVASDAATMREVVSRLAELGHRHLAHAAGPQDFTSARVRRQSFLAACAEFDLTVHGDHPGGPWTVETGVAALRALPKSTKVTAVVAANDLLATGVVHAARERGWDVPGRLSVTGWDDLELGRYAYPPLSTVHVDRESAGGHAMRRLIASVRGEPAPEPPVAPLTRIEFRGTTGPRGRRR